MVFIDANRRVVVEGKPLGVGPICRVLQVAPSSFYAAKTRPPSKRACRDAELIPELMALWGNNHRVYGARKLWKAARRAGLDVGRDQVARLMRAAGIEGVRRTEKVRTTRADPVAGQHPDLVERRFQAEVPNQLRCHSDPGSQFTSLRYREPLAEIGAMPSIGSVGDSYDNALAETVNGYYKAELIRGPARQQPWKTVGDVEFATLGWVHWHNTTRLHGYLDDRPPAEFEQAF